MNLDKKIKQLNESVDEINNTIDSFLITENVFLNRFAGWLLRKKIFGSDDEDKEDKISDYQDKLKTWSDSDGEDKEGDIDELLDDAKETLGITDEKEQELRKLLHDIAKSQKELLQTALNTKGLTNITIKFSNPIEFMVK